MVFARVADYLGGTDQSQSQSHSLSLAEDGSMQSHDQSSTSRWKEESVSADIGDEIEEPRPPFIHAMIAGGTGGMMGDMLMHSLDTVKTRQQGDPHMPPKYTSMTNTYTTIWRQEGIRRGLYAGVTPAFLGSWFGTVIFFGSYEYGKRFLINHGVAPSVSYFAAGWFADLAASPLYVPSEVLKTRLQLQGRHNNPHFNSGYNYKSTWDALKTIVRKEGAAELFSGYKATLARDLPFSAIQFAVYEQEQKLAKAWCGRKDIGLPLEIFTGASAGGLAGVLTCPLDVVKTRIQTQLDPALTATKKSSKPLNTASIRHSHPADAPLRPHSSGQMMAETIKSTAQRHISTGGPSTSLRNHGQITLDTESVLAGLRIIYKAEGFAGLLRGVGPRGVWTSIQSGTVLVMYQQFLKLFEAYPLVNDDA
ncbi:mitochondrial carrier domain-containing protein [Elsinoe ampelina]|uniref:Mitochondrial carrier domain-containing protein n=1 Tax=Elsinoe ampelina TaxID=302913 RepID=A0A6A6FXF0_9PEZI|nr:mitochondrial carrier domain-containing protein [Elsinoe ampelina]